MKKPFTFIFLFLTSIPGFAQKFDVDTIYKTGALDARINVVVLGDGFTETELPRFRDEAKKFADFFLAYEPYNHYKPYFNFFSVSTPSRESGVTNPGTAPDAYPDQPVGKKDTYYQATFGEMIHRLVTVNGARVNDVLAYNLASYDLAVVLVNTEYYGGSGGPVSVHTLHSQANTIGVHEIGHTFSRLNDEYWAGPIYGWEAPNMTANSNAATIKWKNWLDTEPIGIFRHGDTDGAERWFKPTSMRCLMEVLNQPFCQVCRETTTERILDIINPIENVTPPTSSKITLSEDNNFFRLSLLHPEPNTLKVEWKLDGEVIARNQDDINLPISALSDTEGILTATIFDSTAMSRMTTAPAARTRVVQWAVEKLVLSAPGDPGEFVKIFPNPAKGRIHLETPLPGISEVSVFDPAGRAVNDVHFEGTADIPVFSGSGIYLYRFKNGIREATGRVMVE